MCGRVCGGRSAHGASARRVVDVSGASEEEEWSNEQQVSHVCAPHVLAVVQHYGETGVVVEEAVKRFLEAYVCIYIIISNDDNDDFYCDIIK